MRMERTRGLLRNGKEGGEGDGIDVECGNVRIYLHLVVAFRHVDMILEKKGVEN